MSKPYIITDLSNQTTHAHITIEVQLSRWLRFRLWFALQVMKVAYFILPFTVHLTIEDKT